jgi:putative ABC transport system permease protein
MRSGQQNCRKPVPNGSARGQRIKLAGINYTVVGVLEPKGTSLGGDQDNFAIIPVTTGMNRFGRWKPEPDDSGAGA